MSADVHVVAVGARTPVGLKAESSAAAIRAGVVRMQPHPSFVDGKGKNLLAGCDAKLDPAVQGPQRLALLATSVVAEVAKKLKEQLPASTLARLQVAMLLGLPEERPGFQGGSAQELAGMLTDVPLPNGHRLTVELAGRGHAAAFEGLNLAEERLAARPDELFLVCGVDSYLDADVINWLSEDGRLRGRDRRGGFVVGEAAAALLLASDETVRRLGLPSLARVRGVGIGHEEHVIRGDEEVGGLGLGAAIAQAFARLRLPDEAADATYCDVNGERYRVEEWGATLQRSQSALRSVTYVSPATSCGDVGAASGALAGVLAVQSWARDYAPGPRALIWASSDGGVRGAAVLDGPR